MTTDVMVRCIEAARTHTAERRWEEAAAAWEQAAAAAGVAGDLPAAQAALAAAGDAAFRADLPVRAARALEAALAQAPEGSEDHAVRAVQLAGVRYEQGDLAGGLRLLAEAEPGATTPRARVLLLDTRIGLSLAAGRVASARADLVALERCREAISGPTLLYRKGQIDRHDGRLAQAVDAFAACAALVRGDRRFDGPLGATLQELGELALYRGDLDDAVALLEEAGEAWHRARRRSGVLRVEALRMQVLAAGRLDLLPTCLDRSVAFATDRELRVLEGELRLACGVCLRQRDPGRSQQQLHRALDLFRAMGLPHLAGRARLALQGREASVRELELALAELKEDRPWRVEVLVALAEALARQPGRRPEALEAAAAALCRLSEMNLPTREARMRNLLVRLAGTREG